MLCLSRRAEESVLIGGDISVKVLEAREGRVRLGISAPPYLSVNRPEIHQAKVSEGQAILSVGGLLAENESLRREVQRLRGKLDSALITEFFG